MVVIDVVVDAAGVVDAVIDTVIVDVLVLDVVGVEVVLKVVEPVVVVVVELVISAISLVVTDVALIVSKASINWLKDSTADSTRGGPNSTVVAPFPTPVTRAISATCGMFFPLSSFWPKRVRKSRL